MWQAFPHHDDRLTILRKGRQDTRERLHYRRRRDDCNCSVQTTAQQIFNANAGLPSLQLSTIESESTLAAHAQRHSSMDESTNLLFVRNV